MNEIKRTKDRHLQDTKHKDSIDDVSLGIADPKLPDVGDRQRDEHEINHQMDNSCHKVV